MRNIDDMRHSLKMLVIEIDYINEYRGADTIRSLKEQMVEIVQWLDKALPKEVEPD